MSPLKIVPYQYVPTKRPAARKHSHSSTDTQTGAPRSLQESDRGVLPEKLLRFRTEETPSDIRGPRAGEVSSHSSAQGMTTDRLVGRGIQDPASVAIIGVSPSLHRAYQHTLSAEADHAQVESVENDDIDTDLPGNLNSLFGDFDIDRYFTEQEALPVIEYNASRAANLSTDAPADHNDSLVPGSEFERSNTPSSSSPLLKEQRGNVKRKRSQSDSLVDSSSDSGASERDVESVFENSDSKRSKSGPWGGSPGFSLRCSGNDDDVAKPTTRLRVRPPFPVVDLAERRNDCSLAELHNSSNSVHDIGTEIDAEDPDSDDDDELSHSPSWYRFRSSTATIESTGTGLEARRRYVARVEDVFCDREFYEILGKEYIDGEVHYLVGWVPTLVRGRVLHKAKAQPLISRFEASCEAQREKKRRVRPHRLN